MSRKKSGHRRVCFLKCFFEQHHRFSVQQDICSEGLYRDTTGFVSARHLLFIIHLCPSWKVAKAGGRASKNQTHHAELQHTHLYLQSAITNVGKKKSLKPSHLTAFWRMIVTMRDRKTSPLVTSSSFHSCAAWHMTGSYAPHPVNQPHPLRSPSPLCPLCLCSFLLSALGLTEILSSFVVFTSWWSLTAS